MREILFRAKRDKRYCAEQEWTYGVPFIDHEGDCIFKTRSSEYVVDPETVGQYTGLTDKNGKIFEGDIVKACVTENTGYGTKKYESIYEIKFHEKYCYFYLAREKNNLLFDGNWSYFVSQFEVIGNIHDNPELLKEDV